jgi:hypothetical protein
MWEKGKETVTRMKFIHWKKQQLLMIFVLALAISVAWGTILPISTQTPPAPNPCEQLRVDIQNRAKQDAEADRLNFFNTDKKKKTIADILNLYKEANSQASCFQQTQLWDIYEQQYDIHKYPAWIPVLAILVLGGIVGTVISGIKYKMNVGWASAVSFCRTVEA